MVIILDKLKRIILFKIQIKEGKEKGDLSLRNY